MPIYDVWMSKDHTESALVPSQDFSTSDYPAVTRDYYGKQMQIVASFQAQNWSHARVLFDSILYDGKGL